MGRKLPYQTIDLLPRSTERGRIEACRPCRDQDTISTLPRSTERGRIEASFFKGCLGMSGSLPRSTERGRIEAWPPGIHRGCPGRYHVQRNVDELKRLYGMPIYQPIFIVTTFNGTWTN